MTIPKGVQAFPRTEYLRRLSAVKAEMEGRDVDVLLVLDASNITYLSGYTTPSGYVPQALVIDGVAEEPTFILRRCDAPAAMYECFMEQDKIIGYPEALIGNLANDGYDAVIDFLNEAGLAKRGLGIEMSSLPAATSEKFKSRLPEARVVDCTKLVSWLRLVKSDLEIEVMREAAAISDAAMKRASEVIRAGVAEADAAAEIAAALIRGANGKPGTALKAFYLCASPRIGTCHIPWTGDVFRDGSQINLELGGTRHGYSAGLMRTFSIGAPSERLRRIHEAQVEGLEAALAAVRPGSTCSEVANAFYKT
ncbi:MAG: aminopeptidase P family protein, partial [Mesorhizobium sp.]